MSTIRDMLNSGINVEIRKADNAFRVRLDVVDDAVLDPELLRHVLNNAHIEEGPFGINLFFTVDDIVDPELLWVKRLMADNIVLQVERSMMRNGAYIMTLSKDAMRLENVVLSADLSTRTIPFDDENRALAYNFARAMDLVV